MANIRVDLNHAPLDGETVTFKAPCDASTITGMVIYYPDGNSTVSKPFTLTDANGADIGVLDNIFAKDAIVKAILDTDGNKAYIQNPNTNTYLEEKFDSKVSTAGDTMEGNLVFPVDKQLRFYQSGKYGFFFKYDGNDLTIVDHDGHELMYFGYNMTPQALGNTILHTGNKNLITPSDIGAAASSHGTHVTYGTSAKALGTSSAGTATTVSRSDHVHALPALTSCTGTLTVAKGGTGATTAAAARTNLGAAATATYTATVTATWAASNGYYYQDITVSGMLATDNPIVDFLPGTDNAANAVYSENMCKVLEIFTYANKIRVWATEAISSAFPIQLKVVR